EASTVSTFFHASPSPQRLMFLLKMVKSLLYLGAFTSSHFISILSSLGNPTLTTCRSIEGLSANTFIFKVSPTQPKSEVSYMEMKLSACPLQLIIMESVPCPLSIFPPIALQV